MPAETYTRSRYNIIFGEPGERYLYNTFTGSLQPLSDECHAVYAARDIYDDTGDGCMAALAAMGAIMPAGMDERSSLLELGPDGGDMAGINHLAIWLLTTERCNYRCFYCYEDRDQAGDISYTADEWLAFLDHFPSLNQLSVTWFGGEPLLNFGPLEELALRTGAYCRERGIFFHHSLITNAVLLTPPVAARLKELGLSHAQITLDGPAAVHERYKAGVGTFDKVLDNIYQAATLFPVTLRLNTDKNNAPAMPELIDLLARRGFDNLTVYFAPITCDDPPEDRDAKRWQDACYTSAEFAGAQRQLRRHLKEAGCPEPGRMSLGAGRVQYCGAEGSSFYVLGVDGSLARCPHLLGRETAGTLRDGIYDEAFRHPWRKAGAPLPHKCLDCLLLPLCQGGCPLRRDEPGSMGDSCVVGRYDMEEDLKLAVAAARGGKDGIFTTCSTREKVQQLQHSTRGVLANRHQLRQAALRGGGLGMLLAAMGRE